MVRRAAVIFGVLAIAMVAQAKPRRPPSRQRTAAPAKRQASRSKKKEAAPAKPLPPRQPMALHLRGIDLGRRLLVVEVDGFEAPPPANYFTMTDERGYHYVAQTIYCQPPFPSGTRVCQLEIPHGYERHRLTAMELHETDLHSAAVIVPADEVRAAWAAAEQLQQPARGAQAVAVGR